MTFLRSSAAVGLALVLAAGAAQAQQTNPQGRPDGRARAGAQGMRGGMGPGRALLRGIELTTQQRERLRAIDQKYQAEGKPLRDAMRPAMEEARAARQRGDTVAARQAWERTADQRRQTMALQERRLAEVRGILTAEQQRQFDANRAELKTRMEQRRAEGGRGGEHRGRQGRHGGPGRGRGARAG
jgi:Spy/CpxP family protein refolding chaperone